MSDYKILVAGKELKDAFDIHVKLGMSALRLSTFALPNNKGQHNDLKLHDPLEVSLGSPLKKYFGGRIETLENLMEEGDYLFVEGFGHGTSLFDAVLTEEYENVNGKEIIKDAIALTDLSDAKVDPDNEIATNFTREYDREPAFDVVQEICEQSAKSNGVVGFYFLVDVSKVVHAYPFDKFVSDHVVKRGANMSFLRRKRVACTIKNKIWQLGLAKKRFPIDDDWCETLTNWTSNGSLELSPDAKVGSYSINAYRAETSLYLQRAISSLSCEYARDFRKYHFWYKTLHNLDKLIWKLYAPNSNNYFKIEDEEPTQGTWTETLFLEVGRWGKWVEVGSPDWGNLQTLRFEIEANNAPVSLLIDGAFFDGKRFEGEASDQASINEFGEKPWKAPIEEKLESDAECVIVAREWLKRKKVPSKSFEVGTSNLLDEEQGKLIRVIDNEVHNIDETLRILELDHSLTEEGLKTSLEVSWEPLGFTPIFLITARQLRGLEEGAKRRTF